MTMFTQTSNRQSRLYVSLSTTQRRSTFYRIHDRPDELILSFYEPPHSAQYENASQHDRCVVHILSRNGLVWWEEKEYGYINSINNRNKIDGNTKLPKPERTIQK